jgi:hypothetical protein
MDYAFRRIVVIYLSKLVAADVVIFAAIFLLK